MKKILIVLAVLALAAPCFAEEETEHRVEITIVYNALPVKDAVPIIRDILEDHADACKVEVKTKKVGGENVIYWDSITKSE